jgi:hypothetical protein
MSPAETALEVARLAADILAAVVPASVGAQLLTDAQVRRANTIADGAEVAKFGPEREP